MISAVRNEKAQNHMPIYGILPFGSWCTSSLVGDPFDSPLITDWKLFKRIVTANQSQLPKLSPLLMFSSIERSVGAKAGKKLNLRLYIITRHFHALFSLLSSPRFVQFTCVGFSRARSSGRRCRPVVLVILSPPQKINKSWRVSRCRLYFCSYSLLLMINALHSACWQYVCSLDTSSLTV